MKINEYKSILNILKRIRDEEVWNCEKECAIAPRSRDERLKTRDLRLSILYDAEEEIKATVQIED